jgi:D-alanyl-D-alanine carboxypeptidase
MLIEELTETLALDEGQQARMWRAYVIREALDALGVYVPAEVLARESREDMEQAVCAALRGLPLTDLHAVLAVAEQLAA